MILTFTPNPVLDITYRVPELQLGETHRVREPISLPGGKAVNVTRILAAAQQEVTQILPLGGATGKQVEDSLNALKVPFQTVPVSCETRRAVVLVTDTETTNINEVGNPYSEAEWEVLETVVIAAMQNAKVFVLSGSLPPQTPADMVTKLVQAAQRLQVHTIVDVSGPALLDAARAGAEMLKPNARELAEATGLADPLEGAQKLLQLGAEMVLVSLGADGMMEVTKNGYRHAKLGYVIQGNTTGAGDAAVAACARKFLAQPSPLRDETALQEMLHDAVAWSAAAVQAEVAGEIAVTPEIEAAVTVGANQPLLAA